MTFITIVLLSSFFYNYCYGVKVFDLLSSQNLENSSVVNGKYFVEIDKDYSDLATSMKIEKILYHSQSKYQEILIFNNKELGNVLTLNGIIQLTEWDEFAYHEIAIHVPLFAHPNPRKVLIIGGGDGGSVREALKHSTIEKIVLVEIDDEVINASKIFFPTLSAMLDHPKVRVKVGDGVEFLRKCALRSNGLEAGYSTVDVMDPDVPEDGRFDVIITDNSNMDDLGSINEALFGKDYFKNIHDVLRPPHGIMSSLAGGHWLFLNFHRQLDILCHKLFPTCRFATFNVPTWTGGTEGLLLATIDPQADLEYPNQQRMSELNTMKLRLYNRRIHNAIFALPQFLLETLKNNSEKQKKSDKEL